MRQHSRLELTDKNISTNIRQELKPDHKPYTVSRLSYLVKLKLEGVPAFKSLYVVGETSDVHKKASNIYFSLKDKKASIKCVFFDSDIDFEIEDGMEVVVLGSVSSFQKNSEYRIVVNKVVPVGVGEFAVKLKQLKKKLKENGYFDLANKKPVPKNIESIGLVTGKDSAAFGDVLKTIKKQYPFVKVFVSYSNVQGEKAVDSIIDSIKKLEKTSSDVILLTRGGGSSHDLYVFNDERLAKAIFECKKPLVAAVGHDRDVHVADLTADFYYSTPTMAINRLLPDIESVKAELSVIEKNFVVSKNTFVFLLKNKRQQKILVIIIAVLVFLLLLIAGWWLL